MLGVVQLGKHLIKSWSSTQTVIALSSGEAEYYGMVKGGSVGLGLKAMMNDLGMHAEIEISTDAEAAKGIAARKGLGKVRHIEVNQLWLQDRVAKGDISVRKVKGTENLADALTKYVSAKELDDHKLGVQLFSEAGRHAEMPKIKSLQ